MSPQQARNPMKDDSPLVPPLYFTIIQDTTTDVATEIAIANASSQQLKLPSGSRTYHPRVHYLFSDDADNPDSPSPFVTATGSNAKAGKTGNERAIVVDFAPDARTVLRATSLSPDWQVTNAETSSLAMRSGATGGGIDIGKMLAIEGIGSGNANHKLVAAMTRQSKQVSSRSSSRSGSRQADESQAENELEAAFTYAQLFTQTNLKLNRLIEQSPPDEYLKIVEQLKTVNLRSPSPSRPEENLAENNDGLESNRYDEPGFSSHGSQRNIMQESSAEPAASLPTSTIKDLKGDEEPPAFTSDMVTSVIPGQATLTLRESLEDSKDLDKTIAKSDNETHTTGAVSEASTARPEIETHRSMDESAAEEPPASSPDTKQDSFPSPWAA
ncbi:hypothetical protein V1525DRAFT_396196 [Lipomyces kononenkoae]|uniref:Uncharacterized protein n=1 Tax=Lipomyces kononenkoae TaxID=34357 RepID=A0ACC3T9E2_LIPKO